MLRRVGIPDPADADRRLSAPVLAAACASGSRSPWRCSANPDLLIADEPTTALDVTLEAQIIHLLRELKRELPGLDPVRLAQSRPDRRALRPGRRDVRGRGGREGDGPRPLPPAAPSLHPGAAGLRSRRARPRPGRELATIPGDVPGPACDWRRAACSRPAAPRRSSAAGGSHPPGPRRRRAIAPAAISWPTAERGLLEVEGLRVRFRAHGRGSRAWLRGVARSLHRRGLRRLARASPAATTFALVGESGSGKTTLGRAIVGLVDAQAGSIRFDGAELLGLSERALKPHRRSIAMMFQDPVGSLSPRLTVRALITEPFRHPRADRPRSRGRRRSACSRWSG